MPAAPLFVSPAVRTHAASHWRSLEFRLAVVGALLIAVAVAVTTALATRTASVHSQQMVLDQSLAQTRRLAAHLSARLVAVQLLLHKAGERAAWTHSPDPDAAGRMLADQQSLADQLHTLFVADTQGQMRAMWSADKGVHHSAMSVGDRPYFRRTVEQLRPVISEPVMGRASSQPVVVLTMPVRNARGELVAVFGGAVRLAQQQWLPHLLDRDESDPSTIVVADAQGRIIVHPDEALLMRDVAHEPALSGAAVHWVAQGRPADPFGESGRFDKHLVSWAGVPDAEWLVFRTVPAAAALAGVDSAKREAMIHGAVIAMAGGLALMLVTVWLLRPLRQLERSALAVVDGADAARLDWPRAGGEIGRLTQALRSALSDRQQAAAEGRRLTARLQAVRDHAPVGFAITRARAFDLVSAHFERLLGYPSGGLDGMPARAIYASDAVYEALGARVSAAFQAHEAFDDEIEFVRRDGQRFWGRLRGKPVCWDDDALGTIWTLEDVSAERAQREALTWASSHDPLTGLANRAAFERELSAALDNRRDEAASVLFIDLDRFKQVNDEDGHPAGDAVLRAVAAAMRAQVRGDDLVARVGGDEFAVLLKRCDQHGATRVAEKIRAAVAEVRVPWGPRVLSVDASIGVAQIDGTRGDLAAVMSSADQACYAAKRDGRGCVRVHGAALLRAV
jgi:diguanylate cyclase (GGDEF)-like protein/PAS domain S-box-containing protein